MGGQAFAAGRALLDMRAMNRVIAIDMERGILEAEGGAAWPEIIAESQRLQRQIQPALRPRISNR